jgi:hypothetical protein
MLLGYWDSGGGSSDALKPTRTSYVTELRPGERIADVPLELLPRIEHPPQT